jgi:hypothetical protein
MEIGCLLLAVIAGSFHEFRVYPYLILTFFMGLVYLWAVQHLFDNPGEGGLRVVVLFAVIFYLTLIWTGPLFDNDIYRYLWDGKVSLNGINPYRYAPADPALSHLRDGLHGFVGYPLVHTVYPPAAQLIFLPMRFLAGESLIMARAFLGLFFLGSVIAAVGLLGLAGMDRRMVLVYAWNPLVLKEFADSGHIDTSAVFFLLVSIWALFRGRETLSGAALAAASLVKFYPLFSFPFLFWRCRRKLLFTLSAAVAAIILYLPFISSGKAVLGSLGTYLRYWIFNHGPYYDLWEYLWSYCPGGAEGFLPRAAFWILVAGLSIILSWKVRQEELGAFCSTLGLFFFAVVIFSPTVMPWYLTWSLSLLIFRPYVSVLSFSILVNISYLYYYFFRDIPLLRWVEFGTLLLLIVADWALLRSGKHPWRVRGAEECSTGSI